MTVCVAGMHRSGTSMIAKLLHLSGIDFGAKEESLPPSEHNPEGYWERAQFVRVNESLLTTLDGSWYCPPPFPEGWESQPEVVSLTEQAADLIAALENRSPWGWKDPRNSITLPFWQRLAPELKVVIAVRNPLEVAQSLHRRDHFSYSHGLSLWMYYYRCLLTYVPASQRIMTHYDVYFPDAARELDRILKALGMPRRPADIEEACAGVSPGLKHNQLRTADLRVADVPTEIIDCYEALCAEAGSGALQFEREPAPDPDQALVLKHVLHIEAQLRERDAQLRHEQDRVKLCKNHIAVREQEIDALQKRQLWKRYVVADRLATYYWSIRHPLGGLARYDRQSDRAAQAESKAQE